MRHCSSNNIEQTIAFQAVIEDTYDHPKTQISHKSNIHSPILFISLTGSANVLPPRMGLKSDFTEETLLDRSLPAGVDRNDRLFRLWAVSGVSEVVLSKLDKKMWALVYASEPNVKLNKIDTIRLQKR